MSFYGHWQPLIDEDAHTALGFGFLRHAPKSAALDAWLSDIFQRPVQTDGIAQDDFWPGFRSVTAGSFWTVPELVFRARDPEPLTVVVEVKPGFSMHVLEQIQREVVDVAAALSAARISCVMVGADLARPPETAEWNTLISGERMSASAGAVSFELHYSSFARLGGAIRRCGETLPDWQPYADDVIAQLRRKALLGYEGAPLLDDLGDLTVMNAVEAFNRTVRAARQFFLQVHSQTEFQDAGLGPADWNYRMLRNGKSEVPTQSEAWFDTTVLVSHYKHESLPDHWHLFVAFDFTPTATGVPSLLAGLANEKDPYRLGEALASTEPSQEGSEERASIGSAEYVFQRRPWLPGQGEEDVSWAVQRLRQLTQEA